MITHKGNENIKIIKYQDHKFLTLRQTVDYIILDVTLVCFSPCTFQGLLRNQILIQSVFYRSKTCRFFT